MLLIAYPQSIVRMHAVVFMFQIFREPFRGGNFSTCQEDQLEGKLPLDADAKSRSSELRDNVRTSVLCPGRSTEKRRVASGEPSLDFEGWGTLYTSNALEDNAIKSYRNL